MLEGRAGLRRLGEKEVEGGEKVSVFEKLSRSSFPERWTIAPAG